MVRETGSIIGGVGSGAIVTPVGWDERWPNSNRNLSWRYCAQRSLRSRGESDGVRIMPLASISSCIGVGWGAIEKEEIGKT